MNLRNLRYLRFNSSTARDILQHFYTPGKSYPVWFGPLRGMSLHYDRSVNFHAVLGLWDPETFELLMRVFVAGGLLPRDAVIADVGSNIGYYALWFARRAADAGRIYAFEPNPDVLVTLRGNLERNGIENVEVVESACGDHAGTVEFFLAPHHHCSSLHADWAGEGSRSVTADMTTLDEFFAPGSRRPAPRFIKIDIEGGGTFALPGCRRIFSEDRPFVLIESHTPLEDQAISDVLCTFNYHGYRLGDRAWVTKPEAVFPDAEGVRGTLLLIPSEHRARVNGLLGQI
ncbi:MAG TPA: FkbM family methyltransferase [Bryobacteraceae bacterium]|jgi:FkbM family methyltransferase|nr:FkbM family methyltransferase [Bryobacteraceae bacterium]